MPFKDHFSRMAGAYAAVRPTYPESLFAYLASVSPARTLAWDAATGSGQAAVGLARHFQRVVASDASAAQIAHAARAAGVLYRVATAEASGLPAHSADLITVAQAAHWLDLDRFYDEVRRVGRPGGIIALWSYGYFKMTPAIEQIVDRFAEGLLRSYWPPEREAIANGYRLLPFPFDELSAPPLDMEQRLKLPQLDPYFHSWSGTQRYIDAHGVDPVPSVIEEIAAVWGNPEEARVARFDLFLRVGRLTQ